MHHLHLGGNLPVQSILAQLQRGDRFLPVLMLVRSALRGKYVLASPFRKEQWNTKLQ